MNITVNALGLIGHNVYVAHADGGWGPENKNSDWEQNPMSQDGEAFVLKSSFLRMYEEFKLIVPQLELGKAYAIYAERQNAGVHVGDRFDYDQKTECFWFLADSHPVVRLGQWNQNNINR